MLVYLQGTSTWRPENSVNIQTGQSSQRKLIKCWNVTESMGLALFNIFKAIKCVLPIWRGCVFA